MKETLQGPLATSRLTFLIAVLFVPLEAPSCFRRGLDFAHDAPLDFAGTRPALGAEDEAGVDFCGCSLSKQKSQIQKEDCAKALPCTSASHLKNLRNQFWQEETAAGAGAGAVAVGGVVVVVVVVVVGDCWVQLLYMFLLLGKTWRGKQHVG